ncbi:DNA-(Apurinic or apyrimidinic site) lyase /endonuclease III [Planctomycetales bacterium 10988]|nr:DNA-(Apurinic or apyrimidinic site) lyase /endonuclease III [Planctomycetales bacterium 10988]
MGRKRTIATSSTPEEVAKAEKSRVRKLLRRLKKEYPAPECALLHDNPLQLLVATILSAQCTDKRVNIVTPSLFQRYSTAEAFAEAELTDLEEAVKTTGFYRNKAKNIKACCQQLVEHYQGEVPKSLEKLVVLPGIGRKTANVVLGVAFGIPSGVVVDTHVGRLSRRLGLTSQQDAVKIERDLIEILPKKEWIDFSHRLIDHGRKICGARKPKCDACVLLDLCPQVGVK